jgi:hypothetical protein
MSFTTIDFKALGARCFLDIFLVLGHRIAPEKLNFGWQEEARTGMSARGVLHEEEYRIGLDYCQV